MGDDVSDGDGPCWTPYLVHFLSCTFSQSVYIDIDGVSLLGMISEPMEKLIRTPGTMRRAPPNTDNAATPAGTLLHGAAAVTVTLLLYTKRKNATQRNLPRPRYT